MDKSLKNVLDLLHICGLFKSQKQWCMFEEVYAPSIIGFCVPMVQIDLAIGFHIAIHQLFCGEIAMKLGVYIYFLKNRSHFHTLPFG
jgi:hypothetical protein